MVKKERSKFLCSECGYDSVRWLGKCPACNTWGSMKEFRESKINKRSVPGTDQKASVPEPLKDIRTQNTVRMTSGIEELDRVLGGGCIAGMTILVGGDPGIGKSTLLLQYASKVASENTDCMYISGEESAEQIKERAERIGAMDPELRIYCENDLANISERILKDRPDVIILDSIQTVFDPDNDSIPGASGQLRSAASVLVSLAKKIKFTLFLIGHVTKEGAIAGPKMIEHMVDAVLYFEGDKYHRFRILRSEKNRFGSTNEIGMFEMGSKGLIEVKNASQYFLNEENGRNPGASVTASLEGSRPLLLEIQALVTESRYGTPQRNCVGFDIKRLGKIVAVLDKILGFNISGSDIFLNVTGGVKLSDPGADMSVAASLVSSFTNVALPVKSVFCGEVGLGGEIRAVSGVDTRINECLKLGFEQIYLPKFNIVRSRKYPEQIIFVSNLSDIISMIV